MPIRQQVVTDPAPGGRAQNMDRVVVRDDNTVVAVWTVALKDGTRTQATVKISDALQASLNNKAAFQTVLDQIRDDTFPRIGA